MGESYIDGWLLVSMAIVGGATFLIRASYRWIKDENIHRPGFALEGSINDVMTHLVLTDLIRSNGHRIPRQTPQFLLAGEMDYPALFHKLMSYISRKRLERLEWLVSPFFESLHAILVYLAALWLLDHVLHASAAREMALVAVAGFALSPLLTQNPHRSSVMGERCFGFMFGHAFLFFLVEFTVTHNAWFLAGALPAFSIAAASSKFAVQAMTFLSAAFALLMLDPVPLVVLLGAYVCAVVTSAGYVWRVLKGTIRHARFYATFLVHVHDYTSSFSTRDLMNAVKHAVAGRLRASRAALLRHPISRMLIHVPWIVPFVIVEWQGLPGLRGGGHGQAIAAWAWSGLIVAMLTYTDTLKFLGEAERYLEYALLPMIILSLLLPPPLGTGVLLVILAFSVYRLWAAYAAPVSFVPALEAAQELVRWLAAQKPSTVFAVPGRLCFPICYRTAHRGIWWFINAPREPLLSRWKALFGSTTRYPFVDPGALALAHADYGADTIVLDRAGVHSAMEVWGLNYDLSRHRLLFENEGFLVFDARPRGGMD